MFDSSKKKTWWISSNSNYSLNCIAHSNRFLWMSSIFPFNIFNAQEQYRVVSLRNLAAHLRHLPASTMWNQYIIVKIIQNIPSRELTYPTLGKGKSSSKCHFWRDMLVPWWVSKIIRWFKRMFLARSQSTMSLSALICQAAQMACAVGKRTTGAFGARPNGKELAQARLLMSGQTLCILG